MAETHSYPATLAPDEGYFVVTFPDVPEAITQGDSIEDALVHGTDCLEAALEFYIEDGRAFPVPSVAVEGQHLVTAVVEETTN